MHDNLPLNGDGTLQAYAWPDGYPIYYLDRDNCILCPKCANKYRHDEQESFRPIAADIHWEGEPLQCEQCNAEVVSVRSSLAVIVRLVSHISPSSPLEFSNDG